MDKFAVIPLRYPAMRGVRKNNKVSGHYVRDRHLYSVLDVPRHVQKTRWESFDRWKVICPNDTRRLFSRRFTCAVEDKAVIQCYRRPILMLSLDAQRSIAQRWATHARVRA